MSHDPQNYLQHFQDFGDTESLLEFIKAGGSDTNRYREVVRILTPVFDTLSVGLQPAYNELNQEMLEQNRTEVENILEWMAQSNKADMQAAAEEIRRRLAP